MSSPLRRTPNPSARWVCAVAFTALGFLYQPSGRAESVFDLPLLRNFTDHTNAVSFASFGIDDPTNLIVTAGEDKMVRLFDPTGQQPTRKLFPPQPNAVPAAALSRNGKLFVTASLDNVARVWDRTTLQLRAKLIGHKSSVLFTSFNDVSTRVVTASKDRTARVWDLATGRTLFALEGHTGTVYSAVYSTNGKRIITASGDGTARVWDANVKRPALLSLVGHRGSVLFATYNQDDTRIVTAGSDGTARVWDASGHLLRTLIHDDAVTTAAFNLKGDSIVTASLDQTVKVWDTESGRLIRTLRGHDNAVRSAFFGGNRDHPFLVSASDDRTVKVWDATEVRVLLRFGSPTVPVYRATYSPDGQYLASQENSPAGIPTLVLRDAENGKLLFEFKTQGLTTVQNVAFSPRGDRLLAGGEGPVTVLDAFNGNFLRVLPGMGQVNSGAWNSDGSRIVVMSDGSGQVWDAATGQVRFTLQNNKGTTISDARYSPNGKYIVADGTNVNNTKIQFIQVFSTEDGRLLNQFSEPGVIAGMNALNADSNRIITNQGVNYNYNYMVSTFPEGQFLYTLPTPSVNYLVAAAFSPDGSRIASAGRDGIVRVHEANTGEVFSLLIGQVQPSVGLGFSPNGTRLLSFSGSEGLRVWDTPGLTPK